MVCLGSNLAEELHFMGCLVLSLTEINCAIAKYKCFERPYSVRVLYCRS